MNSESLMVWRCKKCFNCYSDKAVADSCCTKEASPPAKTIRLCACGEELKFYNRNLCEECFEKDRFNKAEKLGDYDGWVYAQGYGSNEGYFESIESLKEHCDDEDIEMPDYVYTTIKDKWDGINILDVLERIFQDGDFYEEARENVINEKELVEFIKKWNEKQNIVSYSQNCKQVVLKS